MEDVEKVRLRIIEDIVTRGHSAIASNKEVALYAYVEGVMALVFSCGVKLNDMGRDIKDMAPDLMQVTINAFGPFMDLKEMWDSDDCSGNDVIATYMHTLKSLTSNNKDHEN